MTHDECLDSLSYYDIEKEVSYYPTVGEMVAEYQVTSEQQPKGELYYGLILEEYDEWLWAEDSLEELKELADLVYVVYGYARAKGFDLDEAVYRVHENNMARMYQDDGTIHRREDGKIIKNPNTPKVKLSDLVKQ